jgi:hypothetical protein
VFEAEGCNIFWQRRGFSPRGEINLAFLEV